MAREITAATLAGRAEAPRCGAMSKQSGEPCGHFAGFRTTHPGEGRCYLHGGLRDGDKRLKTGRYSIERGGIQHQTIGALYEMYRDDPDPTGLFDEIAVLRALTVNFIDEYEVNTAALLAWYSSVLGIPRDLPSGLVLAMERAADLWEKRQKETDDWSPDLERMRKGLDQLLAAMRNQDAPARPRKVSDITDATKIIDSLGRMAERVDAMRSKNAISEAELNRLINQMGRVVDVLVADEDLKVKIREGWIGIVTR